MENAEYEVELNEAESRLERLRARYEQYFRGVDRREPTYERKDLERRMLLLRRERPRNTALRFRSQSLLQRYTTFRTHWNRICRQIENGTYKRDVQRMRERRERVDEASRVTPRESDERHERGVVALDADIDVDKEIAAALAAAEASAQKLQAKPAPPRPRSQTFSRPEAMKPPPVPPQARAASVPPPVPAAASRRPPPPPVPKRNTGEGKLRTLYDEYISARRQNNERIDNLSFNKVRKQIEQMEPRLQKKYGKDSYDFKVVVKDGRVGLKPVGKS
jgi:hypothetical protein